MKAFIIGITLSILLSLIFSAQSFSQPPAPSISGALFPFVNEKQFLMAVKSIGGLNEGASGANVNWDFTSLINDHPRRIDYRLPSSADHSSSFSSATEVEVESTGSNDTLFTFHIGDLSKGYYAEAGYYQISNKKLMVYSKPRILIQVQPKNFGDSIVNPYEGKGSFDSAGITGTIVRHGVIRRFYESYGSLKTNYGSYTNACRVKTLEQFTDSIVVNSTLKIKKVEVINFIWVTSTAPGLIHTSISHIKENGISHDEGFYYCVGCTAGIKQHSLEPNIIIYPQPARDYLSFEFNLKEVEEYNASINDLMGREVLMKNFRFKENENHFSVNTSMLSDGFYNLTLTTKGGVYTKRIIIDHR